MSRDNHLTPDQIRDFLLGKLPGEAIDEVVVHLDECPDCECTVAAMDGVSDTVVSQIASPPPTARESENTHLREALHRVLETNQANAVGGAAPVEVDAAPTRLGVYQLREKLGEGGMGAVYKALHTKLDKIVAIKLLPRDKTANPQTIARFEREMKAVGKLDHSHIVRALDAGELNGTHFLVMEYVEGIDLGALVKQLGPLPIDVACELVRQAALGLQYAHQYDMVHRDVKPSNLMLTTSGEVKVLDLGLALLVDSPDAGELTSSGQIMGTVDYMAPEQLYSSHQVDIRADIFALGTTLYKLLSGEAPFAGGKNDTVMSKMIAVASSPHMALSRRRKDISAPLSQLMDRLLEKDPAKRPATPLEVAEALSPFAAGANVADLLAKVGILAKPSSDGRRSSLSLSSALPAGAPAVRSTSNKQTNGPPWYRRPAVLLGGLGAAAAILLGIILTIRNRDGQEISRVELHEGDKIELVEGAGATPHNAATPAVPTSTEAITATPPVPVPTLQDIDKPFVVISEDGRSNKTTHFGTLLRAIEQFKSGDTIEVRGNGPFIVSGLTIDRKKFHLRAGAGYRPQFRGRLNGAEAFVRLTDTDCLVEGCDFLLPSMYSRDFIAGSGPKWEFINCRFLTSGDGHIFTYGGERLRIVDSLISQSSGWDGPDCWLALTGRRVELEILNSIVRVGGRAVIPAIPAGELKVTLNRNTISTSATLFQNLEKTATNIQVIATGNIFQLNEANGNSIHQAAYDTWKDKIHWEGSDNLYVGIKEGFAKWHDKEGKQKTYGLAGWELFPGRSETSAKEAPAFYPTWREPFWCQEVEDLVRATKRLTTLPPRLKQTGGRQPGPNWSLVGPGAAYLRALAARGKPVPSESLRPKPYEGGVYVLLHGGIPVKGFDQLQQAFDAADSDDTVEIRTDDETSGFVFTNPKKIKALTVRAAPGYLPIVLKGANWIVPDLTITIEGLHFRGVPLNLDSYGNSGKHCRVARLANCSFSQPLGVSWGQIGSVGDSSCFIQAAASGSCVIENCLLTGAVYMQLDPRNSLEIRNSVLGAARFICDGRGEDAPTVDVDRSVLYAPGTYSNPGPLFTISPLNEAMDTTLKMRVNHTWLENTCRLVSIYSPKCSLATWSGEGNIYAMGEQEWPFKRPDARDAVNLGEWKRFWKSDADSVELESSLLNPRQWKLLPGTPGYQQGPGGQDLGADVSRVATVIGASAR